MSQQPKPTDAQPGKGAAGDQWAVQMAQTTEVNPIEEHIPSNVDVAKNVEQVKAAKEQEEYTDLKTTDGYTIDESGQLNNLAVEPPMYYEKDGKRVDIE